MNATHQPIHEEETLVQNTGVLESCLVVHNDNVNTFEWVIDALIDICKHSQEQAEQSAFIIHHKGKYAVRHGKTENLKPMKDQIVERGINATIE